MILVLALTICSLNALSTERKEAHADPNIEKICLKQIRSLDCGIPEDHKAYITCVDLRAEELSDDCQAFHSDEVERMKHED